MTTIGLQNDNGTIAYEESGSGPLVICVPSLGDLRAEYRFLAPRLAAAGYRVVCMDVRGVGESSTRWADFSVAGVGSDLLALIRALNAGPAFIVGTSMAAGAAVWAAAEAPQQVRGVVLVSPFVRGEPGALQSLLYRLMFSRPWGPDLWGWYYNTLYPTQKPADFPAYRAALRANLAQPGRMEALLQNLLASKAASEQRLGRVLAPALVVMGSKDPDFKDPAAEAQRLGQQLHAQVAMIAGAGHYPHAELPEACAPHILAFLNTQRQNG
jgi:pimeloyl-ACP methyl ester carboxylesterase